jgi:hypothetical protein
VILVTLPFFVSVTVMPMFMLALVTVSSAISLVVAIGKGWKRYSNSDTGK